MYKLKLESKKDLVHIEFGTHKVMFARILIKLKHKVECITKFVMHGLEIHLI